MLNAVPSVRSLLLAVLTLTAVDWCIFSGFCPRPCKFWAHVRLGACPSLPPPQQTTSDIFRGLALNRFSTNIFHDVANNWHNINRTFFLKEIFEQKYRCFSVGRPQIWPWCTINAVNDIKGSLKLSLSVYLYHLLKLQYNNIWNSFSLPGNVQGQLKYENPNWDEYN